MPIESDPVVGQWYEHLDKGQKFEVISLDEDVGTVEIQYFDGDLDELDLDTWYELEIQLSEQPEDWTGPVDNVAKDDLGYTETAMAEEDWSESTQETKRTRRPKLSDEELDEEEDELEEDASQEEPWTGEV